MSDDVATRTQAILPMCLAGPFALIGYLIALRLDIAGGWALGFAGLFAVTASTMVFVMSQRIALTAARGFSAFVHPSGASTPYQQTFSFEESLAARGDMAGALAAYAARIEATPFDVELYAAAAEHAIRANEAQRAAGWLAALRRIPGVSAARERYASQRLVDLYLGALADEGRALVELRRLVDRFPSSREAAAAKDAIASLKARRGVTTTCQR